MVTQKERELFRKAHEKAIEKHCKRNNIPMNEIERYYDTPDKVEYWRVKERPGGASEKVGRGPVLVAELVPKNVICIKTQGQKLIEKYTGQRS